MMNVLAVAAGGALGSVLRFAIQKWLNLSFPFGTLAVNIIGCFFAGWLMAKAANGLTETRALFLMTGFCGGFTTFSAFSVENIQLLLEGRWALPAFYIAVSVAGGLLAAYTGYKFFRL
ncbi:MAG TPA: fluoride efflux transporter CrcB [Flavisolibacter sp.]|nr:fluoride efflux transporter CrcB [Flavisolibacter sp.]